MQSYKKFVKYRAITALKVMKAGEIAWKKHKMCHSLSEKDIEMSYRSHTEVYQNSIRTLSEHKI